MAFGGAFISTSEASSVTADPQSSLPVIATGVAQVTKRTATISVVDNNDIQFSRITGNSGLSQAWVGQIIQDNQGFIWLGTQYGLNRFDGYNYKLFAHDPSLPGSLSGVWIYALFKDRNGTIWVGSGGYLDRFDPITETFTHFRVGIQSMEAKGVPATTVVSISEDRAGQLWLATSNGLFRFDPTTHTSLRYGHDPSDPLSLSSSDIKYAAEDRRGTLWVAHSAGIESLDPATGRVSLRVPLPEARELSFFEDSLGVFWVYNASGSGLAVLDRQTNLLTHYDFEDPGSGPQAGTEVGVYAILEDSNGTLWLATGRYGLLRLDRAQQRLVRYRHHPEDEQSISSDSVMRLFEDREGIVWVALHGTGINTFASRPAAFRKLPYIPPAAGNRGGTLVNAVYQDSDERIWLSYIGVLESVDRRTGVSKLIPTSGVPLGGDVVSMTEDQRGTLWFGTVGGGLSRLDRGSNHFRTYRHDPRDPDSLSNDVVTRLLVDRRGTLWATTWDGLNRFDEAKGKFRVYKANPSGRIHSYQAIAEDRAGILWLGSAYTGVHRFDPQTGHFQLYHDDPDEAGTLSNNRVNTVLIDHAGALWVGTQRGLNVFDPTKETFTSLFDRDGLAGSAVSCLQEDSDGRLWMSTNRGISRFDPRTRHFDNFYPADGLPGVDLGGWGSCLQNSHGEMFFAGFAGAVEFVPQDLIDTQGSPPIVLTDLEVKGTSVPIRPGGQLSQAVAFTRELTLSHADDNFAVAFSALSFRNSTSNRYRYRLDGFESDWRTVSSDRRIASYTNLPAGRYELHVQGATNRGPWSEPGAVLGIRILPAWWESWQFRVLLGLLFTLLLIGGYIARIATISRNFEIRLQDRIDERTRIARDLHDTLLQGTQGVIYKFEAVAIGLPKTDPIRARLDQALERADQVLAQARLQVTGLRASLGGSQDLFAELKLFGQSFAANSTTQFIAQLEGTAKPLHPIVREEVYRIATEAISNAFTHAQSPMVRLQMSFDRSLLTVQVLDDGIGIVREAVDQAGDSHRFGLLGMRERAQEIGAALEILTRPGAGTEVRLRISGHRAYRLPSTTTVLEAWLSGRLQAVRRRLNP